MAGNKALGGAPRIPQWSQTLTDFGVAPETDAELLARFVEARDDLSFAKLVERHGPLVLGVCRRVLLDEQEAEDAFQAVFLVLARKAPALRRAEALPAWLHTTAFRMALRARAIRSRRQSNEVEFTEMPDQRCLDRITADDQASKLDEELHRLPEKLRLPLFLCCIEGRSREEAAAPTGLVGGLAQRPLGARPGSLETPAGTARCGALPGGGRLGAGKGCGC